MINPHHNPKKATKKNINFLKLAVMDIMAD